MAATKYIDALPNLPRRSFDRDELLKYLSYDRDSGVFKWKVPIRCGGGARDSGSTAGTIKSGYIQIKVW